MAGGRRPGVASASWHPPRIITGASRGLGLALARALAARGWRLVIDARGADALEAARRELAAHTDVTALAGDVADERHRRALVAAAGDRIDAARQQREHPRPEPAAAARRLPARRRSSDVCAVNVLAPLRADPARAARHARRARGSSTSPPTPPSRPTRAGAATARRRPRSSSSRACSPPSARARASTPSTRATCTRAMHQEAFPGEDISDRPPPEDSVPGAARADRGRPAQRALPATPTLDGRHLSAQPAFELARAPRGARAARGARAGARRRAHARRRAATGASSHARVARPARLPAPRRPGRHQHVGHAARRAPARRADGTALELHLSTPLPGAATTAGSSSCARGAEPFRGGRAGDVLDAAGRRARDARGALPRPARACGSRALELPEPLLAYLARHGAPIRYRYVPDALAAVGLPDGLRDRARQRRDAERRAPVHAGGRSPRWRRAASTVAPIVLHTGVSSPERGERPYPERYRVPAATARLRRRPRAAGAGASSPSARPSCARWRPSRAPTAASRRGRGLDRARRHPARGVRVVDGLLTGWHEPEASHLRHARGGRRPRARRALLRGRAAGRLPAGTSSATCTSSCRERVHRGRPPRPPGPQRGLGPGRAQRDLPRAARHDRVPEDRARAARLPSELSPPRRSARRRRPPPRRRGRRRGAGRRGRGPR